MSHYGLLASAFTGHLIPMTALGRELKRRGHRITVVAPLDAKAKVREADLEFHSLARVEFPEGEWDRLTAKTGELVGLKASWFMGHWLGRFTRGILRDLPAIASTHEFDGLVMDQIGLGAESVCAAHHLPLAVACCALTLHAESRIPPLIFSWRYGTSPVLRLRNQLGLLLAYSTGWPVTLELLRFRLKHRLPRLAFYHMNEMPPSLVQVAQQPAFLDFPRLHLPDHFHYTGPWREEDNKAENDFPWARLDGRPLIYASMGTLQNRLPHVFQMFAEACSGLDAQLVIALGRKGASIPESLPGNPLIIDYGPQEALPRRASLVITHGGLNTTLESLREGLPLIVVPVTNDQPGIAARIRYLGVGDFIPVQQLTTIQLCSAVKRVLTAPKYRETAARFAKHVQRLDGKTVAADLIEAAFTSRQRITHDWLRASSCKALPAPR